MKFHQDAKRDAALVHAAMNGVVEPIAMALGWKPDDLHAHGEWLRKQGKPYIDEVVAGVEVLEAGVRKDG